MFITLLNINMRENNFGRSDMN